MPTPPDALTIAAAVHAEELASAASDLARRLRSGEALPAATTARLAVALHRLRGQLARLQLGPADDEHAKTARSH